MGNINQIYVQKSHKTSTYSRWNGHGNNKWVYQTVHGKYTDKSIEEIMFPPTKSFRVADSRYFQY